MTNIPIDQLNQMRGLLEQAKSITIVTAPQPSVDTVAASLALYLALSATGKSVSVISPAPMTVAYSHLVGVDKIGNTIGSGDGRNLVISFPYQEGSIEKVSYNIEAETFNLVIEPREGYPQITPENIRFSTGGGGQPDILITMGISKLFDLHAALGQNQALVESKPVIAIDTNPRHERFGKVDIVTPSASSLSEIVTHLLASLSLRMDEDIAANLFLGISDGSENFTSPTTSASTFEAAALLSRSGARKSVEPIEQLSETPQTHYPSPIQNPQRAPRPQFGNQTHAPQNPPPAFGKFPPRQQQSQPQKPFPPRPMNTPQSGHAAQPGQIGQQQPHQRPQQQQPETPSDWLKPKIYKGSSLS